MTTDEDETVCDNCEDFTNQLIDTDFIERKTLADNYISSHFNMLCAIARTAAKRMRRTELWEDLRSEMILQVYAAAQRFDPYNGVPFEQFIGRTVSLFPFRRDVKRRVEGTTINIALISEVISRSGGKDDADEANLFSDDIASRIKGKNSQESNSDVNMLLEQNLAPEELMLIRLHFEMGLSSNDIDRLTCCSRSTTYHRLKRVLDKIKALLIDDIAE